MLVEIFGSDGKDSYNVIGYYEYKIIIKLMILIDVNDIVVVVVSGVIMDGLQLCGIVGGDIVVGLLCEVCNDSNVKVVVLCVDSLGGSVFVFEVICNEIEVLKVVGKFVVVLMLSFVVFGGYWILMSVDKIVV